MKREKVKVDERMRVREGEEGVLPLFVCVIDQFSLRLWRKQRKKEEGANEVEWPAEYL